MIFSVLNSEETWHQQLVHLPTSPLYWNHFILGNPKSHFQQYYSHILQVIYVISEENKLRPFNLPTTPEERHRTTLWNAKLFIWLKVMISFYSPQMVATVNTTKYTIENVQNRYIWLTLLHLTLLLRTESSPETISVKEFRGCQGWPRYQMA